MDDLLDDYFTEEEMCKFLKITKRTIQTRRSNRDTHPPYIKIGNQILYPKAAFYEWLKKKPVIRELRAIS